MKGNVKHATTNTIKFEYKYQINRLIKIKCNRAPPPRPKEMGENRR